MTATPGRGATPPGRARPGTTPSPRSRTLLPIRARPGARRDEVVWDRWRRRWLVSVSAPAVDGAANRALVDLLADRLGVKRTTVRLVRGTTSSDKLVEILDLPEDEVRRRLEGASGIGRAPARGEI